MTIKKSWSDEEDRKWSQDFTEYLATSKCEDCGSNKITMTIRGKPYRAFVDWHKAKSAELGWKTLSLSGCTRSGKPTCTVCTDKPNPWSEEEDKKWSEDFAEFLANTRCEKCGSNQITQSLRGRPYMAYVDWHKAKSAELGWKTLSLSGCTSAGNAACTDCADFSN